MESENSREFPECPESTPINPCGIHTKKKKKKEEEEKKKLSRSANLLFKS
jgi:hypothetical protein